MPRFGVTTLERHALHATTLDTVVDLPASCVTKCAFGGPDLLDMYITTARLPGDEENRAIEPQAGGLFHVRPGVRGMPPARFAG